jgi:hypothetical protein
MLVKHSLFFLLGLIAATSGSMVIGLMPHAPSSAQAATLQTTPQDISCGYHSQGDFTTLATDQMSPAFVDSITSPSGSKTLITIPSLPVYRLKPKVSGNELGGFFTLRGSIGRHSISFLTHVECDLETEYAENEGSLVVVPGSRNYGGDGYRDTYCAQVSADRYYCGRIEQGGDPYEIEWVTLHPLTVADKSLVTQTYGSNNTYIFLKP